MKREAHHSYARLIGGIDPGLGSGALVAIGRGARDRVLASQSLVEPRGRAAEAKRTAQGLADSLDGWSDKEFVAATIRAQAWMENFTTALNAIEARHGTIDVFAVESFVDQRSRAREEQQRLVKNRWMTPLVMGMLAVELNRRGATVDNGRVVYQNAGIVIRQLAEEIGRLKARRRGSQTDMVLPGDRQITNDHERKAFAHALALALRLPR